MSATKKTATFKNYDDLASAGKDNVEAMASSGAVLAETVQEFNKAWFGIAQSAVEDTIAAGEALLGCKTLGEVFEVQSDFAKSRYGKAEAEGRRFAEMSVKAAEKAAAPIVERADAASDAYLKSFAV